MSPSYQLAVGEPILVPIIEKDLNQDPDDCSQETSQAFSPELTQARPRCINSFRVPSDKDEGEDVQLEEAIRRSRLEWEGAYVIELS